MIMLFVREYCNVMRTFFFSLKEKICFDWDTETFVHGSLTDKGIVNYSAIKIIVDIYIALYLTYNDL